jgi:hypothetical protein
MNNTYFYFKKYTFPGEQNKKKQNKTAKTDIKKPFF